MPGKVYRTAIYCRLSREDGDKVESNSIASQRAICEDYIARHDDLEIVCEPFVDDGYSGVSFNRPNFKKLEDAIRKGAIDCIVVKDLSRFSRNYIDGGRYLEKIFPQLGIRFNRGQRRLRQPDRRSAVGFLCYPVQKPHQRLLLQGYIHENPIQLGGQAKER